LLGAAIDRAIGLKPKGHDFIIDRRHKVEGDLRREVALNIKRLIEIGSHRGVGRRPQPAGEAPWQRQDHPASRPRPDISPLGPTYRALSLGIFAIVVVIAFEFMAVATALPVAARELGGLSFYAWALTGAPPPPNWPARAAALVWRAVGGARPTTEADPR